MKQVLIDTSYKFLTVCCVQDTKLVSFYHQQAFKSQSEKVMVVLDQQIKNAGWKPTDIQRLVIVNGPGSYTGVRLAMTIAKTLAAISDIKVATITSIELIAKDAAEALVVLDARSDRVYGGLVKAGVLSDLAVYTLDQIKELRKQHSNALVLGDGSLLSETDDFNDNFENIGQLISKLPNVEDVDFLTPLYLKEISAY